MTITAESVKKHIEKNYQEPYESQPMSWLEGGALHAALCDGVEPHELPELCINSQDFAFAAWIMHSIADWDDLRVLREIGMKACDDDLWYVAGTLVSHMGGEQYRIRLLLLYGWEMARIRDRLVVGILDDLRHPLEHALYAMEKGRQLAKMEQDRRAKTEDDQ